MLSNLPPIRSLCHPLGQAAGHTCILSTLSRLSCLWKLKSLSLDHKSDFLLRWPFLGSAQILTRQDCYTKVFDHTRAENGDSHPMTSSEKDMLALDGRTAMSECPQY